MQVGEVRAGRARSRGRSHQPDRIAVDHAVVAVERRDPQPDAIAAPHTDDGVENFEEETGAVFDGTAVGARAVVGSVAEELVDQVAVCSVHLDAVEAGGLRVFGRLAEALNDARDLFIGEFRAE
jgi:hypothetical protein